MRRKNGCRRSQHHPRAANRTEENFMKTKFCRSLAALALLALSTLNPQSSTAFAQGTAFTYQGRLNASGAGANGSYDLQFTLYTTNVTGTAIAGPVTNTAVAVTNGLFITTVNFGNVFTGASNWLALAVSTNAANNFTTLAPRQQITPTPYAIFANTAGNLNNGLTVQQNSDDAPNVIGGSSVNVVTSGVEGATIGGGGTPNFPFTVFVNSVTANFGTVGGGVGNTASGPGAFVGGGGVDGNYGYLGYPVSGNTASGAASVVAGGLGNQATSSYATVPGGAHNTAGGSYATVGGGNGNKASGIGAFVGGGGDDGI